MKPNKTSLFCILGLLALFLALTARMTAPYLLAILVGSILALLCGPPFKWLLLRGLKPWLAAALVTLGLVTLVFVPLGVFGHRAVIEGLALQQRLSDQNLLSVRGLTREVSKLEPVQQVVPERQALEMNIRSILERTAKAVGAALVGFAVGVPNMILQFLLVVLTCFFAMMDGSKFFQWLMDKVPLDADLRERLAASVKETTVSVVWANLAAAAAQAALLMASFLILQVPQAFLAAGAVLVCAWLPIIGAGPIWIGGGLYLFFTGSLTKLAVLAVLGLVCSVLDNAVRSWVLKGRQGMHPLVSFVAILGGIQMLGVPGLFIGPILVAILISLLQILPVVVQRLGRSFHAEPMSLSVHS